MDLTSKNRKELTNLQDPIQLSELNKQLRWLFTQVMGGLPLKALNGEAKGVIEQTAEKFSWIVAGGDSPTTMVLTDRLFQLIAQDINLNGRVVIGGLSPGVQAELDKITEAMNVASDANTKAGQAQSTANSASGTAGSTWQALVNLCKNGNITIIDGAKIATGSITTDKLNVNDLYVGRIYSPSRARFEAYVGGWFGDEPSFIIRDIYSGYNNLGLVPTANGHARVEAARTLGLSSYSGGTHLNLESSSIESSAHFRPTSSAHGVASLGTRGGEGEFRFKNVNITGTVDSSSDARMKRDIADLDTDQLIDLLRALRPRRFRMIADGEDGKTRWGFIAQEVKEALERLGILDAEFFHDGNPDPLSLCYTELIAVLVKGWQEQQAQIDMQDARICALERRLEKLEGLQDDRR